MAPPRAERPPLLVIVGPTAAGKTVEALVRAERLGGEIVGADSVQVYRGLDIGSAKPSAEERARVRHWAIDLWEPTVQANAGAWLSEAERAIAALHERGRTPVVCGGTGLYVRALTEGLAAIPDVPEAIQVEVRARLAAEGARALHAELMRHDPETAARLAPADGQRVARALEVLWATGQSLTAFQERHRRAREGLGGGGAAAARYEVHLVGLFPPRAELERRIAVRARAMVGAGLVDEVRGLLAAGVPPDAPGLMTLGYREIVAELTRGGDAIRAAPAREALIEALARAHRRYAKRQLTWWRRARFDELLEAPSEAPSA